MLKAIDANGKEIVAYHQPKQGLVDLRHKPHFCPVCKQKVILKAGKVIIPHFAHDRQANCPHQGESKTHLQGKFQLYQWCVNQGLVAKLEHYIPSIEQRADVIVKIGDRWVALEYQCSPIATTQLLSRTNGLASKNVYPIWIFGPNYYDITQRDISWNATLKSAIFYNSHSNQDQLFFYDPTTHVLTTATHLFNARSKATAKLIRTPLNQLTWKGLFSPYQVSKYSLYKQWLFEKKLFRSKSARFPSKHDQQLMKQLYFQNLHPQNLPSCVYLPVKGSNRFLLPDYVWQTQVVLFLHQKPQGTIFSYRDLYKVTKSHFQTSVDCVYPRKAIHPLLDYLNVLCQLGFLEANGSGRFSKIKEFSFYKTLDQALKGDQETLKELFKF